MSWVDINPPAKAGRGEYITVATWKRGGLGITLSPDLARRLGVDKGTKARLALILDSLGHKPKAATDEMERAPVAPARTVLLSEAGGAKPSPQPQPRHASLAPRDARGNPVSRANDPRYQIPGGR